MNGPPSSAPSSARSSAPSSDRGGAGKAPWLVEVAGQVTPMSLDQLDAAFRAGVVHEETRVWTRGMAAWVSLAQLTSPENDDAPRIAAWANEPESEREMSDEMPKVDPRLWALSDEALSDRAVSKKALSKEALPKEPVLGQACATQDEDPVEVELGAEDLEEDDDATPCGAPLRVSAISLVPPARASAIPALPPARASAIPARVSAIPTRASALPRVPPPPRSRSLPPVVNITAFESTAPMVRTLSEPVIPVQPPEPKWNYRPWAAAAAAVFGLSSYGLSVMQLASTSSDGSSSSVAAQLADVSRAAGVTQADRSHAGKAPAVVAENQTAEHLAAVHLAAVHLEAVSPPLTTAIQPVASDATAANTTTSAASQKSSAAERRSPTSSRKARKASARTSKKKKLAKAKAAANSARLRRLSGVKESGWN